MCIRDRVPFWAWRSGQFDEDNSHTGLRPAQAQVNDLTRFSIGVSSVHGNGLMTTVALKKGDFAGLHWFEYTPPKAPTPDSRHLAFYPPQCMTLPGEKELYAQGKNGSASPTQHLPDSEMLGCFQRAVNHECDGSCELYLSLIHI
eukprot:TRINITY_DN33099_c0_g1_i2.p1 TRINITY_DN33099_c0_g1~~TRINITY_DN33099_c0_g1_i2.p1  ORF type:complete len:145 (-),score=27.49 TRINITY_DN33099_c0_g1_i2:76-510(-)